LRRAAAAGTLCVVRDQETIDAELRLLAAVRWSIREHGGEPSSRQVDELLDERLAHRDRAGRGRGSRHTAAAGPHAWNYQVACRPPPARLKLRRRD
jgi:hypothetical protein